jgi:hypothetical protein
MFLYELDILKLIVFMQVTAASACSCALTSRTVASPAFTFSPMNLLKACYFYQALADLHVFVFSLSHRRDDKQKPHRL